MKGSFVGFWFWLGEKYDPEAENLCESVCKAGDQFFLFYSP